MKKSQCEKRLLDPAVAEQLQRHCKRDEEADMKKMLRTCKNGKIPNKLDVENPTRWEAKEERSIGTECISAEKI